MNRFARFVARWRGDADYVPHLKSWRDSEPVIAPLALPKIRPLVGVRVVRVARFKQRLKNEEFQTRVDRDTQAPLRQDLPRPATR